MVFFNQVGRKVKALVREVVGCWPGRMWYSRIERMNAVSLFVKGVERGE